MKRLVLWVLLFHRVIFLCGQNKLVFDKTFHDFGKIHSTHDVSYQFRFKNTSRFPVKILEIKSDCACLSSVYSTKSILPNQYDTITIKYAPYQAGNFFKEFKVLTDEKNNKYELQVKGFIEPSDDYKVRLFKYQRGALRLKRKYLNFGTIAHNTPVSRKFEVYNPNDVAVVFTDRITTPKHIGLFFDSTHIIPPKQSRFLVVTYDPRLQKQDGYLQESVMMYTKNKENPAVPMTVSIHLLPHDRKKTTKPRKIPKNDQNTGIPKISLSERQQNLGNIYPKMTVTTQFEVCNLGTASLIIKNIVNKKNCTVQKIVNQSIAPGKTHIIEVRVVQTAKKGEQKSTFTIISNDPKHPELQGEVLVKVVQDK